MSDDPYIPGENFEVENNKSDNQNVEIKNMEIHHHPTVEKKNFKEYFLEFLMIFLAVTLGFFAESYREHLVEKSKEKEYMKEIVENLKYDTIRCRVNAENNVLLFAGMDSLRNELKQAIKGNINANALYYFSFQYTGKFNQAVFNTSTITELKNSGSLRLIENKKIVDEIADYYERKIIATQHFLPDSKDVVTISEEFFSLIGLDDYIQSYDSISSQTYESNYNYQKLLQHLPALHLKTTNPTEFERFYTKASEYEIVLKNYNFWLQYTRNAAVKLIADIQKAYHLEDE